MGKLTFYVRLSSHHPSRHPVLLAYLSICWFVSVVWNAAAAINLIPLSLQLAGFNIHETEQAAH